MISGMSASTTSCFKSRTASQPSIRGMVASIRISEGFSSWVCVMRIVPVDRFGPAEAFVLQIHPIHFARVEIVVDDEDQGRLSHGRGSLAEKMIQMTDEAFARAFERGEVTPADFDHLAHVRVAWVYLREAAVVRRGAGADA